MSKRRSSSRASWRSLRVRELLRMHDRVSVSESVSVSVCCWHCSSEARPSVRGSSKEGNGKINSRAKPPQWDGCHVCALCCILTLITYSYSEQLTALSLEKNTLMNRLSQTHSFAAEKKQLSDELAFVVRYIDAHVSLALSVLMHLYSKARWMRSNRRRQPSRRWCSR